MAVAASGRRERFIARLARIGNLNADGRPILGLDSRDLLEITLESGEGAYLIELQRKGVLIMRDASANKCGVNGFCRYAAPSESNSCDSAWFSV